MSLSIEVGGGYKEGEGDPRDPKPSPSDCFRSIPISVDVCASEEGAEERVRGGI